MARAGNLSGVFEAFSAIPKPKDAENIRKRTNLINFPAKKNDENQENPPLMPSRRLAVGLASLALISTTGVSRAAEYWIDGPLPVPTAKNKITNEDTGTRSFIKKGIYIANIGAKNRMHRLKRYAFDLLAMEDLIGPDTLTYVRRYLKQKSTIMYFDFDEVITAASDSDKQPLTDLANRLFNNFEMLLEAVKGDDLHQTRSVYHQTRSVYQETAGILNEVMVRMA